MGEVLAFGAIASSALVIGALVGGWVTVPKRVLAALLAFAAGALITALAFELFEESVDRGGIGRAALGLAAGAVVFTLLSARLDAAHARATERAQSGVTQAQRDAARQAGAWSRVEDAGRKAREADRARQGPDHERPGERQGQSMGR